MTFRSDLHRRAAALERTVVLVEGWDERVRRAGRVIEHERIARVILLDRSVGFDPRIEQVADLLSKRRPDVATSRPRALDLARDRRSAPLDHGALGLVGLIILQIAAGGFVAGLDAGQGYNTWPLMDGRLVPSGLFAIEPAWRNLFENAMMVQFDHRMIAYAVALYAAFLAWRGRSSFVLLAVVATP